MTVRINKQKINLREKLTEFEDKVNFDEVVRGLGVYPSDGNVGIGTTDPGVKLEVNLNRVGEAFVAHAALFKHTGGDYRNRGISIQVGENEASSAGSCNYISFFDGDGTATGGIRSSSTSSPEFYSGSDVRMKRNIEDCDINGIEKIKSLRLRKWDWNTDRNIPSTDLGFVADELEEVFPELVSRQELDGWENCIADGGEPLKTIPTESKITLTLVKAIQEQQQIIEDLKSRIETLESK